MKKNSAAAAPAVEQAAEEKWPTQTWVCVGKAWAIGHKLALVFHVIEADGSLGEQWVMPASKIKATVGSIYTVEAKGATCRPGTIQWQDNWHDSEQRMIWQTEARAFDLAKRVRDKEKKATRFPAALDALAGLREEYWKADHLGRLAIEVQVLAYLRGYKIKSTDAAWIGE